MEFGQAVLVEVVEAPSLLRDHPVDLTATGPKRDPVAREVRKELDASRIIAFVGHTDQLVAPAEGTDQFGQRGQEADDAHQDGSDRDGSLRGMDVSRGAD
jgi:hypothetical protein